MDDTSVGRPLSWTTDRRFGVELELNAFDGRNRPEKKEELPKGIDVVGDLVGSALKTSVSVRSWEHTHNNDNWVIKPDSSCGMEVCSPVLKGWLGLSQVVKCGEVFLKHDQVQSDGRCSLHVHVNVADCSVVEVASIVTHWIKSEAVFMDSVPANRKRSRYCQIVGMCDMFDTKEFPDPKEILSRMGQSKYFTLNNLHYSRDRRKTIEFRIAENAACTDPVFIKNWVRLVVHFCDMAKQLPLPGKYAAGDPWTSFCWLDPVDVFGMLGFLPGQYDLSPGLKQVRDWFMARMMVNMKGTGLNGVFSDIGRSYSWEELQRIAKAANFETPLERHQHGAGEDLEHWLYNKELRT
jgi:hypothetical protein